MANSFYSTNTLAEYSLNLLRSQMVSQLMTGQSASAGSLSLTEYILGQQQRTRRSGTDMMNDALSGLMRSDAAMLRQASKNMQQGKALVESGAEAIESIQEKVERMGEITAILQGDYSQHPALSVEYLDLAEQIKAIIEGTRFNGLAILDGSTWAADERITPNGATGKLTLQAGNAPSELTLYDLQDYKASFLLTDLDPGSLAATAASLEHLSGLLGGMAESYRARAGLLDSESVTFERQAGILDEATAQATSGDAESLRLALINILMRDAGSLFDGLS